MKSIVLFVYKSLHSVSHWLDRINRVMLPSKMCHVWSTFKSKSSGLNFRIQDMPSDRLDDVIDIFVNYFAKEETMHRALGIANCEETLLDCRQFVKNMLTEDKQMSITICCLDNDLNIVGDIIGASLMSFTTKENWDQDLDIQVNTSNMKKLFEAMDILFKSYNVIKELNLDTFYDDRGIVVIPDYRGQGIAQQFFNIRRKICKDHGVPMTGAWVTSFGSQKAAERDGWETAYKISFDELGSKIGITFKDVPPTCKYMVAKI